jgi:hypothetical protein
MANQEVSLLGIDTITSLEPLRLALKDYCLEQVIVRYHNIYDSNTYSPSGLEQVFRSGFDSGTASITLLGPPGIGKSTLLCKLAQEWSKTGLVFLCSAAELQNSSEPFEKYIIKRCSEITGIDLISDLDRFKGMLFEQKTSLFILVDSVELISKTAAFYNSFSTMQSTLVHDQIRFLNTCDDQIFFQTDTKFFERFTTLYQWPDFADAGFTKEDNFVPLLESYFRNHEISTEISGKAREWCRIPLYLRLFSNVYHRQKLQKVETLKLKYLFDRYIATVCQKIGATCTKTLDANQVAGFVERCALIVFRERTDCIQRSHFDSDVFKGVYDSPGAFYLCFCQGAILTLDVKSDSVCVRFDQLLFQAYITARALVAEMQWDSKPDHEIAADIADLIKRYDEENLFSHILQAIYLVLESMKKSKIMIEVLNQKRYGAKYKAILLRCFGWQNEMSIPNWQVIKKIENDTDRQVVGASVYLKAMLFEKMPDERTMELFELPTLSAERLRIEMLNRLRFDSTLSRLAQQFEPYCHLSEIQYGLISIIKQLEKTESRPLQTGLLNIIDLIFKYDVTMGIETMKNWQNFALADVGILNTWCDVACRNAPAIFHDFWDTFAITCKKDRQCGIRVIQFCLAGGQSAPATALALIEKFWSLNNNIALREKTYSFVVEFGTLNASAAIKILAAAKKETDLQSAPHKLETREMICNASIRCFEKKPAAFKPLIQDWLAHDDPKIRQLVKDSLLRVKDQK